MKGDRCFTCRHLIKTMTGYYCKAWDTHYGYVNPQARHCFSRYLPKLNKPRRVKKGGERK